MTFDGFKQSNHDAAIDRLTKEHCANFGISPLDAIKLFPVLVRPQFLKRFLVHIELFKKTIDVPGDIVELGVFRGGGLMTWAKLLECYTIGDRTKTVYGFENWQGITELLPENGEPNKHAGKVVGGFNCSAYQDEIGNAIEIFDNDRFISWKPRVQLISGDIGETIPAFILDNPGVRFSLIHFDCDLYRPTKIALKHLWPRLSRGGIALFDEYSIHDWPGETEAVDRFFADKPNIRIMKLSWTNSPAGYIVKE